MEKFRIITFYEFRRLEIERLPELKCAVKNSMAEHSIKGTFILAEEGFNATVCGTPGDIERFINAAEKLLETSFVTKSSFHAECPFRKIDVKIKPEIVTLKQAVDLATGEGTHVPASQWNDLISDPAVLVLDTRNDYEFRNGTFERAINPKTEKFSDLPEFVAENLDPERHTKVAMFCTGGIRCEKFAPYMKQVGFKEVFQLEGGILRYLEEVPAEESLWRGECFVFDDRLTVDEDLKKGSGPDYSQPENREKAK
jgi:UPF0176 protein